MDDFWLLIFTPAFQICGKLERLTYLESCGHEGPMARGADSCDMKLFTACHRSSVSCSLPLKCFVSLKVIGRALQARVWLCGGVNHPCMNSRLPSCCSFLVFFIFVKHDAMFLTVSFIQCKLLRRKTAVSSVFFKISHQL